MKQTQEWTIGATVKAGFLSLTVHALCHRAHASGPFAYVLVNKKQDKFFVFTPYNGIQGSFSSSDAARDFAFA